MVAPGKVKRKGTRIVQEREPSNAAFHVRETASTQGLDIMTVLGCRGMERNLCQRKDMRRNSPNPDCY